MRKPHGGRDESEKFSVSTALILRQSLGQEIEGKQFRLQRSAKVLVRGLAKLVPVS